MSDPVTNSEVEDVLSSIRRLVSEEKRPANSHPVDNRLVLTPAQRIPESTTESSAGLKDVSSQARENSTVEFLHVQPTDILEADAGSHDDFEDGDDEVVVPAAIGEAEEEASFEAETDDIDDVEFDDAGFADMGLAQEGPHDTSSLTAKIAALETAIGSIRQEWDPDDAGTDDYAGGRAPKLDWEDDVALDGKGSPVSTPKVAEPKHNDGADFEVEAEAEMDVKPAKASPIGEVNLEALSGSETLYGVDPDSAAAISDEERAEFKRHHVTPRFSVETALQDAIVDTPLDAETAETAEPAPEMEAADPWEDQEDLDDPAIGHAESGLDLDSELIDEAALQDLVSDIVRKELQGALGERITRNVRKLVRREIQRALAANNIG